MSNCLTLVVLPNVRGLVIILPFRVVFILESSHFWQRVIFQKNLLLQNVSKQTFTPPPTHPQTHTHVHSNQKKRTIIAFNYFYFNLLNLPNINFLLEQQLFLSLDSFEI
jgi:hypothetical protein